MIAPELVQQRRAASGVYYDDNLPSWHDFQEDVDQRLRRLLQRARLNVHSLSSRVKSRKSYLDKCCTPHPDDPTRFKYAAPDKEITDVIGVRVTTLLLDEIGMVERLVRAQFVTAGPETATWDQAVPGYQSTHYLVRQPQDYLRTTAQEQHVEQVVEVQIRTVLQHAWAEIQHDILYKKGSQDPSPRVQRQLRGLAGLLELADEQFRTIMNVLDEAADGTEDPTLATAMEAMDVSALRGLLAERYGQQEPLEDVWLLALSVVLTELGLTDLPAVRSAVDGVDGAAVLQALSVHGHVPSPAERLDGELRVGLRAKYVERRGHSLEAAARTRAEAGVAALLAAAAVPA